MTDVANDRGRYDLLFKVLAGAGGTLLAIVIRWQIETTQDLDVRMAIFESKEYPPAWTVNKLSAVQEEQRRLQRQIDRIEDHCPEVRAKPLPPYSWEPEIDDENDPAVWSFIATPTGRGRLR